ncbi:hypothetical protein FRB94_007420 [Tulasnella sp. JGI-2019a]|nr:hypothetical protein FRB93_002954 [Tulasnella sp. JGI-2019a]KAG8997812.1 hypothetical protein FRB94_007420 [Tulasnella sp. JGI-2019a]
MTTNHPIQLLTWPYYLLFTWIETGMTMIAATGLILDPASSYNMMVPDQKMYTDETTDPRTRMIMFQLAVVLFLTAVLLLPGLPKQPPQFRHYILVRLMSILTLIGSAYIVAAIYALEEKMRMNPATWNLNIYMNCGFTLILIAFRVCWLLGVGRLNVTGSVGIGKKASRKGQ